MDIYILFEYCFKCKKYKLNASWKGLKIYAKLKYNWHK